MLASENFVQGVYNNHAYGNVRARTTKNMSTNYNPAQLHYRFWTPQDHQALKAAGPCLHRNRDIAMTVVSRMPDGIHMASGPMTSGGLGTLEANFEMFYLTIDYLIIHEGLNVFSQMPFEDNMVEYHRLWTAEVGPDKYCWPILLEFYAPLFRLLTKKFSTLHFIHGFESSTGARWEYEECLAHGIKIRRLPKGLSKRLMSSRH